MTLSGKIYICSAGETFDSVAATVYGDEIYAVDLLAANPAVCSVPVFVGGEKLKLPVVEVPDNTKYAPAKAPWKE